MSKPRKLSDNQRKMITDYYNFILNNNEPPSCEIMANYYGIPMTRLYQNLRSLQKRGVIGKLKRLEKKDSLKND